MKFFKNILLIIALSAINCMNARTMGGAAQAARPIMQPTSYAQALTMIKTKMQPHEVINNNLFTQIFINSVKSLNLSTVETKAVRDFIKMNPNDFDEIRFMLFSDNGVAVYKKWINELLK